MHQTPRRKSEDAGYEHRAQIYAEHIEFMAFYVVGSGGKIDRRHDGSEMGID